MTITIKIKRRKWPRKIKYDRYSNHLHSSNCTCGVCGEDYKYDKFSLLDPDVLSSYERTTNACILGADPSINDNTPIVNASYIGCYEVVEFLLQHKTVDPRVDNHAALKCAYKRGHSEIVQLLKDWYCSKGIPIPCGVSNCKCNRCCYDTATELLLDAVTRGYYDKVKNLLNTETDPSAENNEAIRIASKNGYHKIVELLLKYDKVDPSSWNDYAIMMSSENGHYEVVELLLKDKRVNPSSCNDYAIMRASEKGHHKIVELLLKDKRVDPRADDNWCIKVSSQNGHYEIVELLMKDDRVNPSTEYNFPIRIASKNGHLEIVKLLLKDKMVNPSSLNNLAIASAARHGHHEIVKLLLKDKRVDASDEENRAVRWAKSRGHYDIAWTLKKNRKVIKWYIEDFIYNLDRF